MEWDDFHNDLAVLCNYKNLIVVLLAINETLCSIMLVSCLVVNIIAQHDILMHYPVELFLDEYTSHNLV